MTSIFSGGPEHTDPLPTGDSPDAAGRRHRYGKAIALAAMLGIGVYVVAGRDTDSVEIVTEPLAESGLTPPSPRSVGAAPSLVTTTPDSTNPGAATATSECPGLSPGSSWQCLDGKWQAGLAAAPVAASGGGRTDRANGCLTEQPGPSFTCQNGMWALEGSHAIASQGGQGTERSRCPQPAPGADWTCEDGAWVPPDRPAPREPVPPSAPEPGGRDPVPPSPPEANQPPPVPPPAPQPGDPAPVPPAQPPPGVPSPAPPVQPVPPGIEPARPVPPPGA